jgi:ketosteroid isomerase-like protein
MSEENVELVRSMYRQQGDPSRFLDLLDEEVVVDGSAIGLLPDHPALIRGKDAVVDYFRHYWASWEDYAEEPTEIIDAGDDRVLVVHYERGRGRGSGTPFECRSAALYTLRADKVARLQYFDTREEALEAAGLSE